MQLFLLKRWSFNFLTNNLLHLWSISLLTYIYIYNIFILRLGLHWTSDVQEPNHRSDRIRTTRRTQPRSSQAAPDPKIMNSSLVISPVTQIDSFCSWSFSQFKINGGGIPQRPTAVTAIKNLPMSEAQLSHPTSSAPSPPAISFAFLHTPRPTSPREDQREEGRGKKGSRGTGGVGVTVLAWSAAMESWR
jgi:hypothetical protein